MFFWNNFDNSVFLSFKYFRLICFFINGILLFLVISGNMFYVCSLSNFDFECLI